MSSAYTYLLGCAETGEAVLIDPMMPAWQRNLQAVNPLGLRLVMTVDTHLHADHITSASLLKREVGSRIAIPALDALPCTDVGVEDGVPLQVGGLQLDPMHTPGHTDNHFAIDAGDRVFTGDAPVGDPVALLHLAPDALGCWLGDELLQLGPADVLALGVDQPCDHRVLAVRRDVHGHRPLPRHARETMQAPRVT